MTYKQLYEKYRNLRWTRDIFGIFTEWHIREMFEPLYEDELTHWHKIIYPRRRKIQFKNIPENVRLRVEDKFREKAIQYAARKRMESDRLDRKLQEMAKTEVLIPQEEMQLLDRECTSNWHTQGMGAARYAISSLESSMQPLLDYGFTAEIRTLNTENRTDAYNHYYYYAEYELWANAESWQLDVCRRRMSVLEWATACWRSGTNPKVYNPWLDDETFERSMSIAMTGGK